jgi:zinc protease
MSTVVRPVPGAPRPYHFPAFESHRLANGVEVVVAPVRRLPLVSIRIVVDAGARSESVEEAGVTALAMTALAEGTTRLDGASLAEEFEQLGATLITAASWDASQAATTVLSDRLEPALRLLAEVVRSPAFPEREVVRLRDERLSELLELQSEPRGLADERFAGLLYKGASRFSRPEAGAEDTVSALTADACRSWHSRVVAPRAITVIMAGDVEASHAVDVVSEVLGSWSGAAEPLPVADDSPAHLARRVHILHRPEAPQTELRLGHVAVPRVHPDYFDIVVMNAILGGVFNSRINLNLRERNAYTYGAFSAFEWRCDAGPFTISTAVATEVTGAAVREVVSELEKMRAGPPTLEELSLCTSYLDGVFPIRFETTDAVAAALAGLRIVGLPDDYYETYRPRIRAVTVESVARAAQQHLHLDRLQILAVGDRQRVEAPLRELGLGEVTVEA